jgi:hypothetical protein
LQQQQQRQQLERQQEQLRQQQEQLQEQQLLGLLLELQERLLLSSSKQPEQRPAGKRSAGIFSFSFPLFLQRNLNNVAMNNYR